MGPSFSICKTHSRIRLNLVQCKHDQYLCTPLSHLFNPIRPGLFSRSPSPGGWLSGPDAKNQRYHQPIEMTLCVSHESIPDAKFESGSFSSFGDMTSQNVPLKRGTSRKIGYLSSENGFNSEKISIYVQIRSFRLKIDPPCQFSSREKFFHFQNFWDASMRKEQQQPPLTDQFC